MYNKISNAKQPTLVFLPTNDHFPKDVNAILTDGKTKTAKKNLSNTCEVGIFSQVECKVPLWNVSKSNFAVEKRGW